MGRADAALIDALYRVEGRAEIINGEIVHMSLAGGTHGYAAGAIASSLFDYGRRTKSGYGLPDSVGFIVDLPRRRSFSPDAAFWTGPLTPRFPEGAPVFAVEVRSPEDYGPVAEIRLAQKRADYFAARTLVVWDVLLRGEPAIHRYRAEAPSHPAVFSLLDLADAEPAVPGWRLAVADLVPSA